MFAAQLTKYTYMTYQPDNYGEVPIYQQENNRKVLNNFVHYIQNLLNRGFTAPSIKCSPLLTEVKY
jgi:hypothetical protein